MPGSGTSVILLVEDNRDDVLLFETALGRVGIPNRVCAVSWGEEVLQHFKGKGRYEDRGQFPLPQLMFLDLHLPGHSGLDVLKWLRQQPGFRGLPVIVFYGLS